MSVDKRAINKQAKGVPFYTPIQDPPAGTPTPGQDVIPTVFKPITIRGTTTHNRFFLSPMCTYSADYGHATDFHLVHLGQYAIHGAGLIMVEATGVQPRGRISPECVGLWTDSQIAPLKRITDFIRSQNSVSAIQLAHAGRKGSCYSPWATTLKKNVAPVEHGGWPDDLISASAIAWDEKFPVPRAATEEDIKNVIADFVSAAKRSIKAGFDVIEIHAAHGYLIGQFLSTETNKRTDAYGGSFENRTRLLREIISAVRSAIPDSMPLFVRISATDWLEHTANPGWTVEDTIRLALELPALGVDLLDVSSSGNSPKQRIPREVKTYQVNISRKIRKALAEAGLKMLVGGVGLIRDAEFAKAIVQGAAGEPEGVVKVADEYAGETRADVVFIGREFLHDPAFVLHAAGNLGVDVRYPSQYTYIHPRYYQYYRSLE